MGLSLSNSASRCTNPDDGKGDGSILQGLKRPALHLDDKNRHISDASNKSLVTCMLSNEQRECSILYIYELLLSPYLLPGLTTETSLYKHDTFSVFNGNNRIVMAPTICQLHISHGKIPLGHVESVMSDTLSQYILIWTDMQVQLFTLLGIRIWIRIRKKLFWLLRDIGLSQYIYVHSCRLRNLFARWSAREPITSCSDRLLLLLKLLLSAAPKISSQRFTINY